MGQSGINISIPEATGVAVDESSNEPNERTGLLGAALTTGINTNIRQFMSMQVQSF